jgi:hypothetical protein
VRKFEFTGIFKVRNQDERDAQAKLAEQADPSDWMENYVQRVSEIMLGWRDVADENGASIPYSVDAIRMAVRGAHGLAFMNGLNKAISEYEGGSKAKN